MEGERWRMDECRAKERGHEQKGQRGSCSPSLQHQEHDRMRERGHRTALNCMRQPTACACGLLKASL